MAARKKASKNGRGAKATRGERPIEQYEHKDKQRANNPPVGLVTPETDRDAGKKAWAYDPHLDPQLQWTGKAEHTSFEVPTVSLHVHERIDPKTIVAAVRRPAGAPEPVQQSLFEAPSENPPLRDALDFYRHPHGWSNRLIAGDVQRHELFRDKATRSFPHPAGGIGFESVLPFAPSGGSGAASPRVPWVQSDAG